MMPKPIDTATLAAFSDVWPILAAANAIPWMFALAPIGAIAALAMAGVFRRQMLSFSEGEPEQQRIAQAVREGAMAYLRRQSLSVAIVFVIIVLVLAVLSLGLGVQPVLSMVGVPLAGFLSALCGWFGMKTATAASARTAAAARQSLDDGLRVAFRAGAVMGLSVVGFALLDISFWFFLLHTFGPTLGLAGDLRELTTITISFTMGASLQALFARVGGGIFTKAADVGADLIGKVEAGIPEDDARNPATIADNVGDNVGDVAGMGADLYESYYGSVLATAALGAAAAFSIPAIAAGEAGTLAMQLVIMPMVLAGVGILASILGIFAVRAREGASFGQLLASLSRGIYFASALILVAAFAIPYLLIGGSTAAAAAGLTWLGVGGAISVGLVAGLVIARATEFYTSYDHPPTQRIAQQALTGPATVIISGIAEGMRSTWAALLTVIVAIIAAYTLAGGGESFLAGLYGVSIAAVGMLATLGITLATDAYGPIADNAGGNAEMSHQPPVVRQRTDMLDSLGNTTAAIGKGFAIGSAALTSLALLAAYTQVVQVQLFRQAERAVASGAAYVQAAPAPDHAHASYLGNGRFALVFPGPQGARHVDAGILADPEQLPERPDDAPAIQVGQLFAVTPLPDPGAGQAQAPAPQVARRFQLAPQAPGANLAIPAQPADFSFVVVGARNGAIADILDYYNVTLTNPRVLGGLFLGAMVTFLFCSMTMSAVGRAAFVMMGECRRQFGIIRKALRGQGWTEDRIADPGNWPNHVDESGKRYPDYAACVTIANEGALREMVVPSMLAVFVPIAVGLILDVPAVLGLLAGGTVTGFAIAVFMANAGGAWDNAKKLIESYGKITADDLVQNEAARAKVPAAIREALLVRAEEMRRVGQGSELIYGKGSPDHKAAVVGDTVGDPFKDTSGPALNILIKLLSSVAVVFAGLVVQFGPVVGQWLGLP